MMIRHHCDLREVRHAEHLPQLSHLTEFHSDLLSRFSADTGVDLVENQRGDAVPIGDDALQRQHDAGQFTTGGNACQRAWLFPTVGGNQKFQVVHTVNGQLSHSVLSGQHHIGHIQECQLFCHLCSKTLQQLRTVF